MIHKTSCKITFWLIFPNFGCKSFIGIRRTYAKYAFIPLQLFRTKFGKITSKAYFAKGLYIVSFTELIMGEDAQKIITTCGAELVNYMRALGIAVVYIPCDKKTEVLQQMKQHKKIKTVHSNRTHKKPVPLR